MKKAIATALFIPVIALLGACNGASSSNSTGTEPVIPFMSQPDPSASLPPCVLDGTVGLDYEQGDDTTYAHTGPHRGNGLSAGDQTSAPADLPDQVYLRTDHTSFNRRYQFVLRNGRIWFKSNAAVTERKEPWAQVKMPACLAGTVIGISVDDDEMIALREDGGIYTMDNALKDYRLFNWSSRWGPLFWQGDGYKLPPGYRAWSWSVVSPAEDKNYIDPAGNKFPVGNGKCSHIWTLLPGGQGLALHDPWLARDNSYGMCTPKRGRFRAINLSASGSTLFVINRYGDMYTRIYDFDLSGDDNAFLEYSYKDQSNKADPAIQLPPAGWVHQPKIPGKITQNIGIHKVGANFQHRILRVQGVGPSGQNGYWQKDYHDMKAADWKFHRTDQPLHGPLLDNRAHDSSLDNAGPSHDIAFERNMDQLNALASHPHITGDDDWAAQLPDFNLYCSPDILRIRFSPNQHLDLILHTTDVVRLKPRPRGFSAEPRDFVGDIEVPTKVYKNLANQPRKVQEFIQLYLKGKRYTDIKLSGTSQQITFKNFGWTFMRSKQ